MKLPENLFRAYDIRGVADRDLTNDIVWNIGRVLGERFAEGKAPDMRSSIRVAVLRDCRLSSPRIMDALTQGLRSAGVSVWDLGIGPTPLLYSAVHQLPVVGGVMITASHNPSEDNGLKIMHGVTIVCEEALQTLRTSIEETTLPVLPWGDMTALHMEEKYCEAVARGIQLARTDFRFVVDAGNGAGGPLALACMKRLGLSPDPIFCTMDGRFPNHHPDPTIPENLIALRERVLATGARVGIAYDGDADRLGVVDSHGEIISGDRLLILFSRDVLRKNQGALVIGEVKCSQTLFDDIARHGGRPMMWKAGHSLIKRKMREEKSMFGGELSGHFCFADSYFGFDDGIYASLRLLEILSRDERSLTDMLADVPATWTTPELRLSCPDAIKFRVTNAIVERYRMAGFPLIDIDGARILFQKGPPPAWGLIRASNTGPCLVLRVEAGSETERDRICHELKIAIQEEQERAMQCLSTKHTVKNLRGP